MTHATGATRDASRRPHPRLLHDCNVSARFCRTQSHSMGITGRSRCRETSLGASSALLAGNGGGPRPQGCSGSSTMKQEGITDGYRPVHSVVLEVLGHELVDPVDLGRAHRYASNHDRPYVAAPRRPPRTTRGIRRLNARTHGAVRPYRSPRTWRPDTARRPRPCHARRRWNRRTPPERNIPCTPSSFRTHRSAPSMSGMPDRRPDEPTN